MKCCRVYELDLAPRVVAGIQEVLSSHYLNYSCRVVRLAVADNRSPENDKRMVLGYRPCVFLLTKVLAGGPASVPVSSKNLLHFLHL